MTSLLPPAPMPSAVPGMVTPPDRPASKQNNWQGIVGAITGLLGLGLLGVIFGALGLQSVRARTATNRGLALTGIIAGGLWMVAGIVVAIGVAALGWGTPAGSTFTASEDLKVGDCYAKDGGQLEEGEMVEIAGLYIVDCASQHFGEVYFIDTLTTSTFPGLSAMSAQIEEACFTADALADVDLVKAGGLSVFGMYPSEDTWSHGDRQYVCTVESDAEDLIGSVLATP